MTLLSANQIAYIFRANDKNDIIGSVMVYCLVFLLFLREYISVTFKIQKKLFQAIPVDEGHFKVDFFVFYFFGTCMFCHVTNLFLDIFQFSESAVSWKKKEPNFSYFGQVFIEI